MHDVMGEMRESPSLGGGEERAHCDWAWVDERVGRVLIAVVWREGEALWTCGAARRREFEQ